MFLLKLRSAGLLGCRQEIQQTSCILGVIEIELSPFVSVTASTKSLVLFFLPYLNNLPCLRRRDSEAVHVKISFRTSARVAKIETSLRTKVDRPPLRLRIVLPRDS